MEERMNKEMKENENSIKKENDNKLDVIRNNLRKDMEKVNIGLTLILVGNVEILYKYNAILIQGMHYTFHRANFW